MTRVSHACSTTWKQASQAATHLCLCLPASPSQQDIARGRGMVDDLFQGPGSGAGGTQNAVMSSSEYLSQVSTEFSVSFFFFVNICLLSHCLSLLQVPQQKQQSTLTQSVNQLRHQTITSQQADAQGSQGPPQLSSSLCICLDRFVGNRANNLDFDRPGQNSALQLKVSQPVALFKVVVLPACAC